MFVVPPEYDRGVLLTFDPGIHTTGVCKMDFSARTGEILSVKAHTLNSGKLRLYGEYNQAAVAENTVLLMRLQETAHNLMIDYRPWAIGCEAPFYNRLFPGAYGTLTAVVTMLQQTAAAYNPHIVFEAVSPLLAKKAVGVAGIKGKEIVKESLFKISGLDSLVEGGIAPLDEHSVDAIAIAICMLKYRLFV